ncbi:hypothetical protein [Paenibacillus sp. BAC0078]
MRHSQKAWAWMSIPAYSVGCCHEASAAAKGAEDKRELHVLKGKSRSLLPRS